MEVWERFRHVVLRWVQEKSEMHFEMCGKLQTSSLQVPELASLLSASGNMSPSPPELGLFRADGAKP